MPAGLLVLNDSGTVQIDESYFNLLLSQKITLNIRGSGEMNFTFTGTNSAIVAIRNVAANCFVDVLTTTYSGSTWTYYIGSNADTAFSIDVYVFDAMPPAGTNFGLSVWNGSGQLVFNSGNKPMRITDFNASRTMAVIQTRSHIKVDALNIPSGWRYNVSTRSFRIGASGLEFRFRALSVSTTDPSLTQFSSTYLWCDVTNY